MGFYQLAINFAAFVGPGLGSILLGQSVALLWGTMFILGFVSAVTLLQVVKQTNVPNTSVNIQVTSYAGVASPS
jgi:MFS family permease